MPSITPGALALDNPLATQPWIWRRSSLQVACITFYDNGVSLAAQTGGWTESICTGLHRGRLGVSRDGGTFIRGKGAQDPGYTTRYKLERHRLEMLLPQLPVAETAGVRVALRRR